MVSYVVCLSNQNSWACKGTRMQRCYTVQSCLVPYQSSFLFTFWFFPLFRLCSITLHRLLPQLGVWAVSLLVLTWSSIQTNLPITDSLGLRNSAIQHRSTNRSKLYHNHHKPSSQSLLPALLKHSWAFLHQVRKHPQMLAWSNLEHSLLSENVSKQEFYWCLSSPEKHPQRRNWLLSRMIQELPNFGIFHSALGSRCPLAWFSLLLVRVLVSARKGWGMSDRGISDFGLFATDVLYRLVISLGILSIIVKKDCSDIIYF